MLVFVSVQYVDMNAGAGGDQKRTPDPLEVGLQEVQAAVQASGDGTWVFCRSFKC